MAVEVLFEQSSSRVNPYALEAEVGGASARGFFAPLQLQFGTGEQRSAFAPVSLPWLADVILELIPP